MSIKPFRFTFSQAFTYELERFAKIHQYDDRHTFKDAWKEWTNQPFIDNLIKQEMEHLHSLEFKGDVLDKMFKSARYYYRKKKEDTEKPQQPRQQYIGVSPELIQQMDAFILSQIRDPATTKHAKISPANTFVQFCTNYANQLHKEMEFFHTFSKEEMEQKIKKTYKNRYYLQRKTLLQ